MEKDLQKEIQYLTNLIQGHKRSSNAPKPSPMPKPTLNDRWTKTKQSFNKPHRKNSRVLHGNRVYKPAQATLDKSTPSQVLHESREYKPTQATPDKDKPTPTGVLHGHHVYKPMPTTLDKDKDKVTPTRVLHRNRVYKPTETTLDKAKSTPTRVLHGHRVYKPMDTTPNKDKVTSSRVLHRNRVYKPMETTPNKDKVTSSQVLHRNRVYKPTQTTPDKDKSTLEIQHEITVEPSSFKLSIHSSSTVVDVKKTPGNHLHKPANSSVPSTSTQTVKTRVKAAKNDKFKWKRQSLSDDKKPSAVSVAPAPTQSHVKHKAATIKKSSHKRSLSHKNSRFKWRRRISSSGSKESAVKSPISPLIAQSKFKLGITLSSHSLSLSSRRRGSFRQRRLSYLLRNTPKAAARRKSIKKSKNRVWVAATSSLTQSNASGSSISLIGREKKTSRGNKQWVASRLASQTPKRKKSGLVSLSGDDFLQDKSGKKLKRVIALTPQQQMERKRLSSSVQSPSVKQYLASRAVHKSRLYKWNAKYQDKSKQYCMFYNKFGKCNHRDTCPYIHDRDKIAVCTKFLKGVCEKTDETCLFSHKISKNKMPVCLFFLRGVCVKEDCPYLHVSVGRKAKLCMDFAKGYCPRGEECTMQHFIDCPEYLENGTCSRGKTCPLRHSKKFYKSRQERLQQRSNLKLASVKEFEIARKRNQKIGDRQGTSPDIQQDMVIPSSPLDWSTGL